MKKIAKNVDSYIEAAPEWAIDTLRKLRRAIQTAAPYAKESISYGMPYYNQNGRLAYFAVHTNHCGFYWITDEDKKVFAKELSKQRVVGNTLQIPKGQKVPIGIIKRVIKSRINKNNKTK